MLTLPIEIGKKYIRRDGAVVEAKLSHLDINTNCVYVGRDEEAIKIKFSDRVYTGHVYTDTGKVWPEKSGREHSNDLVADYIEFSAVEADPNGLHPNSPGAKLDAGKVRPALVLGGFARALWEVSKVGTYGATKYTDNGWMEVADGVKRYDDAKMRHWLKEKMGEKCDKDTTLTHLAHEAWNALARLDLHIRETENEQRK